MIFVGLTQILVVTFLPIYTMHVITLRSSILFVQFIWHFQQGHLHPVHFRYQVHFLLFLFPVSIYATFPFGEHLCFLYFRLQRHIVIFIPSIRLPSSIPPTQFTRHFHWRHLHLVYFRYQVHFLLYLFPVSKSIAASTSQKRSSCQYPTYILVYIYICIYIYYPS